jgi:hypothetical protein
LVRNLILFHDIALRQCKIGFYLGGSHVIRKILVVRRGSERDFGVEKTVENNGGVNGISNPCSSQRGTQSGGRFANFPQDPMHGEHKETWISKFACKSVMPNNFGLFQIFIWGIVQTCSFSIRKSFYCIYFPAAILVEWLASRKVLRRQSARKVTKTVKSTVVNLLMTFWIPQVPQKPEICT